MSVRLWNSKVHGAKMVPTWVLSSPGGHHVGPMNLAIWVVTWYKICVYVCDMWVWQAWISNYIPLDIVGCNSLSVPWGLYIVILRNFPDSKVHGANMGPPGAHRTQVGPMWATWTLLSGLFWSWNLVKSHFPISCYSLSGDQIFAYMHPAF